MLLLLMVGYASITRALPAFPGAEGFGSQAVGGRGGRVIQVVTLADSGPGSLRAAVETTGPRTIVFRVAGTIALRSELKVTHSHITIAGQTAPGEGITLRDHALVIAADEVIVRYLRVRLGDESKAESDAISVNAGSNIMLDHVSASWSVDETLSVSQRVAPGTPPLDRVTVQWSIVAESLNNSQHAKGAHGYGSLIRGSQGARYSFHHNLWAHHRSRMPRPGNYATANDDPQGPLMDFRNNVFYNWGGGYAGYNADTDAVARYNFIGNYYLPGPDSKSGSVAFEENSSGARAFFADNWMDGATPADPWSLVRMKVVSPQYRASTAFAVDPIKTESADVAYQRTLSKAGNSCIRDSVDARIVASMRERAGRIIDSQAQVGGWPVLESGEPYADADQDGMSDEWERQHRLDPQDARDAVLVGDRQGYTHLELFLNDLTLRCLSAVDGTRE